MSSVSLFPGDDQLTMRTWSPELLPSVWFCWLSRGQSRNCFLLWGHVSFDFGFNLDWCRLDLYRFLLYVQVAFQNIANVNSAFLFNLNWFSGNTDSRIERSETGEKLQEWFAIESAVKVVKSVFQFLMRRTNEPTYNACCIMKGSILFFLVCFLWWVS